MGRQQAAVEDDDVPSDAKNWIYFESGRGFLTNAAGLLLSAMSWANCFKYPVSR